MKQVEMIRYAAARDLPGCFEWKFNRTHEGYGIHSFTRPDGSRTTTTAHRAVLILATGEPSHPDMEAAHLPIVCHNPPCISRQHLYWATPEQNRADRALEGGNGIPGYINQATIARVAGVSEATVSRALNDKYQGNPEVAEHVREIAQRLGYRNFMDYGWRALRLEALDRYPREDES